MARVINLTLPLYPGMPVGNVWVYDAPFRQEQIASVEKNGGRIDFFSMGSETGTRLMIDATYDTESALIGQLDMSRLVNRETVVINILKQAEEEITVEEIEERVRKDREYRRGDALLIRTGWGDSQRYRKMGDDYAIKTPHFSDESSKKLARIMKEKETDILAIDVAYIGNCAPHYQMPEWVSLPSWQRPPWPSDEAKRYLEKYTPEKAHADWGASEPLHHQGIVLAALCNTGMIRKKRIKLTALPLFAEKAPGAPVTVVAIEE